MLVAQIFAVVIFVGMFILIIIDKLPRHYITLGSGLATAVIVFGLCLRSFDAFWETLNLQNIFTTEF